MSDIITRISEEKNNYKSKYFEDPNFVLLGLKEQEELSEYLDNFMKEKSLDVILSINTRIIDSILRMRIVAVDKESELKVIM